MAVDICGDVVSGSMCIYRRTSRVVAEYLDGVSIDLIKKSNVNNLLPKTEAYYHAREEETYADVINYDDACVSCVQLRLGVGMAMGTHHPRTRRVNTH
jgi:hypothetical protein